jgi:hypothetical protein
MCHGPPLGPIDPTFAPRAASLRAEQHNLRLVVDPDQDDDDRRRGAVRRFKSLLADVEADQKLADLEQRRRADAA